MALSSELVSQFAKTVANASREPVKIIGTQVEGTAKEYNNKIYVQLDGSDQLTPVISSTAGMKDGDRVTVLIKDHSAKVIGNISSPSAGSSDLEEIKTEVGTQISEFEIVIADKVSVSEFDAEKGRIDSLVSDNVTIKDTLAATNAAIGTLEADNVTINEKLSAAEAEIDNLDATKLDFEIADGKYATIENLNATNADINNLEATYAEFEQATANRLNAAEATIEDLDTTYAKIDFANIGEAAVETLFSKSGIIEDLVVSEGHITGHLVGVTISGDLIEGNTIKADKLVVLGSDGLYYKLNVNAESVAAEQTEYNSLNGSIITANTITAEKINVDDLVAFDATIGGFQIDDNSIHTVTKSSVDSAIRGVYMDNDGQFAIGDTSNYLKYFKDTDNTYKLAISANAITFTTSEGDKSLDETISDLEDKVDLAGKGIESIVEFYAVSSSNNVEPSSWSSTTVPVMTETNKYLWNYERVNYTDGTHEDTKKRIIGVYGNRGDAGDDGLGIASIKNFYLISSESTGVTVDTSGWSETPQATTSTKRYLWNYELIKYTDSSTTTIGPRVIGVHGEEGPQGSAGRGISSVVNYYLATSSGSGVTTGTSGWTSTVQTITATNKYLWSYERIAFTDGTHSDTIPVIIGTYGPQGLPGTPGETGVGIQSIVEYYQVSSSNTTAPTSWVTTPPTMTSTNKYLWNYELITYTDGEEESTAKRVIGVYGDTGATGVGISGTEVTYQAGNSGTSIPQGAWSTTIPTVAQNAYLWTRTIVEYSNGDTSTSYSVGRMGSDGSDGDDGRGIESTTITYQAHSSQTSAPTGSWSNSVPTLSPSKPYLWTQTVITYTDGTSSTAYSVGSTLEGVEVGGRNLLLKSNVPNYQANPSAYPAAKYPIVQDVLVAGEIYTWTVNGTFTDVLKLDCYFGGETYGTGWQYIPGNGTYTISNTFAMTANMVANDAELFIYVRADEDSVSIGDGTAVINWAKLEKGNKATDWSPAPEDTQGSLDDLNESLSQTNNSLQQAQEQITTTSQQVNSLQQTQEGFEFNFNTLTTTVTQLGDQISTNYTEQLKYIKFIDGEIWLGKDPEGDEDDFKVVISNEKIRFLQNNAEVAYLSNNALYVTNGQFLKRLDLGKFAFFPRDNGNLTFRLA